MTDDLWRRLIGEEVRLFASRPEDLQHREPRQPTPEEMRNLPREAFEILDKPRPPLVQGGQGRSAEEIAEIGASPLLWLYAALGSVVLVLGVAGLCVWLVRG